jgi:hypothetical protein
VQLTVAVLPVLSWFGAVVVFGTMITIVFLTIIGHVVTKSFRAIDVGAGQCSTPLPKFRIMRLWPAIPAALTTAALYGLL